MLRRDSNLVGLTDCYRQVPEMKGVVFRIRILDQFVRQSMLSIFHVLRLFAAVSFAFPALTWGQSDAPLLDYMPPAHVEQVEKMMPGSRVIEGGIRFLEIESGEGALIREGDRVEAIYTGKLLDGTVFNRKTGQFHTYKIEVGADPREVIEGWEMSLPLMQKGGRYSIAIPSQFAYKDKGRRGQVPPFSTVIFEIEILDVR